MVALHVQVGLQVVEHVVVAGRHKKADARAVALPAEIAGDDLCQRAIERGGELVDDDPLRRLRDRERQAEPPAFAVAQLAGLAEHQPRLRQPAGREQRRRPLEAQAQRIDDADIGQLGLVDAHHGEPRGVSPRVRW